MEVFRSLGIFLLLSISVAFASQVNELIQDDEFLDSYHSSSPEDPSIIPEEKYCPAKETWDECNGRCQKSCTNLDKPLICPKVCIPGCVCVRGYVRGPTGTCIPRTQCPLNDEEQLVEMPESFCPPRERWSVCDLYCQKNCSNYDEPLICPRICMSGCVCKEGFVRGPEGDCIPTSECSDPNEEQTMQDAFPKCHSNEHYSQCGPALSCQKNCSNYKQNIPCPQTCVAGCVCNEGFVRGFNRRCIRPKMCPIINETESAQVSSAKCPKDEHYSQCSADRRCQKTCSNYKENIPCPIVCVAGCVCDEGLVRGPHGRCMKPRYCPQNNEMDSIPDQFPVRLICKSDEEFSICVSSCPDDCDNYKDPGRKCNRICLPGCACKTGTVRGPDGKCIKISECSTHKTPEDCTEFEYYDTCGTSCPDDCSNYYLPDRQCDKRCRIGCFCYPGYVRGPKGDCIFPFNCPSQQSEPVSIQTPSQIRISNDPETNSLSWESSINSLSSQSAVPSEQQSLNDPESNSFNLEPSQLEDTSDATMCPEGEEFTPCNALPMCQKTCTNYDRPFPCPPACIAGCICKEGFVRDINAGGRCIKPEFCPTSSTQNFLRDTSDATMCPEEEEFSKCGVLCQTTCRNYDRPFPCPRICVDGCICKEGFVRDEDAGGRCIKPEFCPTSSTQNFLRDPVLSSEDADIDLVENKNSPTFIPGCPKDALCDAGCKNAGRRYGICVGAGNRNCVCF